MTSAKLNPARALLGGLLAGAVALLALAAPAQADFSDYAIETVEASLTTTQAGAHPDFTTAFRLTTDSTGAPFAQTRDISVALPPGLIGNPSAVPRCTTLQLGLSPETSHCPQDSQVGVTEISLFGLGIFTEPIYNMAPPDGTVARLGFIAGIYPAVINAGVRTEGDYGVTASIEGPAAASLRAATTTLWGVPADPSHDAQRLTAEEARKGEAPPGGGRASGLPPAPFMVNPTSCRGPLAVTISADSYQEPQRISTMSASLPAIHGCEKLGFEPKFLLTPTSSQAAAPTGLDAELAIPQDETVKGLATSQLRYAKVTLPQGMTIAAGAADGLGACSAQQVGYGQAEASHCPDAAKIGSIEVDSPPLPRTLDGAIYQRTPVKGDLFGIWLVSDELGVHLKLPGEVHADPLTGQLTTVFEGTPQAEGNPQVPLSDFRLHFFGGPRAPLASPSACGTYFAHYEFTPWSGNAPVTGDAPIKVDEGCNTGGFSPKLSAGSTNPLAGAFSGFVTTLTRESGEQNVSGLDVTLPAGVLAKLAGVGLCEGAAAQSGDCPAASQVGSAIVASGPGPSPLWLPQPGKDPISVYLSGPYRGAPYSLVVRAPAQAGPFDLGTVVTRAAIFVDPETTRATIKSDPLPQFLEGVPVSYRTIQVDVDRPNFTLNPTSCAASRVQAKVTSEQGAIASPSARFQVGGCRELGFKPRLALKLKGGARRGENPALVATLTARPGDANIAGAQVALPHSEFLDQAHIRTICTRVQFAAGQCPAGAIYGHARAWTPLLDRPLEGPVYLRSSSHPLPDLVADLGGQIDVVLDGRVDSVGSGIRATFEAVPDAPVSRFRMEMAGGKKGLLVNSTNLCRSVNRATAKFTGQNGKSHDFRPLLANGCGGKAKKHGRHR